MYRFWILFILLFLVACSGQSKEELLLEGNNLFNQGNIRGAIVLYKNALEKDVNFLEARIGLADAYLKSGSFNRAENEFKKILLQTPSNSSLLLKLATIYIQQNKLQAALLELDKFHASNPETAESLTLNGRVDGAAGDFESAEISFKKALLLEPEAIEPRLNLAKVYLQRQDNELARNLLNEIILKDRGFVQAYYLLAGLETRAGNREEALSVYQSLVQNEPNELQAHYMIGLLQMDMGLLSDAQKTVSTVLTAFKDSPESMRLKGLLLYRQGKYEDAILAFGTSLKAQQHVLTYFFLGLCHFSQGQLELALNQFQKALDLNPDFERARTLVSMTLLKQNRIDDAVIEIKKVLRANPENAYAHNILGSAYLAKGEYDEGMVELERATEIDPNLTDAHLKRGLFHLAKGDGAQGEADLIKAVDAAPEILNSRLMLVTHYLRQKNYAAAIESLKEGMDGSATDALLNNYLAAAYFSQKKPQQAVAALNFAKQVNPDYLTPYFNLASYYAAESKYDDAIAEYRSIVARDNKNIKALLGLAAIFSVQGDDAEVVQLYKQLEATGTAQGFVATVAYHLKQNELGEALDTVKRGLALFPADASLLEIEGGIHRQAGRVAEAESAYIKLSGIDAERGNRLLIALYLQAKQLAKATELVESSLESDPHQDYPYLLSASFSMAQKNINDAENVLLKGIQVVENSLRLKMQLASVYEKSDDLLRAESLYRQIIQTSPRFSPAYTALGFLKEETGDKGQALELYRNALKYDSKNIAALNNAAYLLVDNFGQAKESLDLALAAYRLKPSEPRIMDTLGYVLLQNNRPEDALNLLEKASELLPSISAIKLHLAMANIALGHSSEAKTLLDEVIASGVLLEIQQAEKLLKTL